VALKLFLHFSGGMDMVSQAIVLGKKPHVIIATPGRLVDHLENTKGFTLRALKYLVMDEADRILNMDFEVEVDKILSCLPRDGRMNQFYESLFRLKFFWTHFSFKLWTKLNPFD
jgi:superfamily II DNA/RNA helicase